VNSCNSMEAITNGSKVADQSVAYLLPLTMLLIVLCYVLLHQNQPRVYCHSGEHIAQPTAFLVLFTLKVNDTPTLITNSKKMEAVYLKSMGVAHGEICRLCHISRPTLTKYLHSYQANAIDGLKRWEYAGHTSELAAHSDSLEAHFRQPHPATSSQAAYIKACAKGMALSPLAFVSLLPNIPSEVQCFSYFPIFLSITC